MEHVEGRLSVLAALNARRRRFQVILVSYGAHEEKIQELLDTATALGVPVRRVDPKELDDLAHGTSHGGVLAICSNRPLTTFRELNDRLDTLSEAPLLLLLEGVDDARNLGFTLRTAEAMGVHAVLIKKHLWDFDPVEVARPSSGAYERMDLLQIEGVEPLQQLQSRGLLVWGCVAGAKKTMYDVNLAQPTILAIGGEKRGLSGAVRAICDGRLSIPTTSAISSLSLSHAGAIVMAEAMRQRRATWTASSSPGVLE